MSSELRELRPFYISRILYSLGYFLLLPTLPIILIRAPYSFSLAETGLVIMCYGLADRGLGIFWPTFVRRCGVVRSQIFGIALGAACIGLLIFTYNVWLVMACMIGAGVGYSIAGLAARGVMTQIADDEERLLGFSRLQVVYNAGAMLGSVIAFALPFRSQPAILLLVCIATQLFGAALMYLLPKRWDAAQSVQRGEWSSLFTVLCKGEARQYGVRRGFQALFYFFVCLFLYVQLYELLPVSFEKTTGVWPHWGWAFAMNAALIALLQERVVKAMSRTVPVEYYFSFGFLVMMLGSIGMALVWRPEMALFIILCYTIGEIILVPQIEYIFSTHVHESMRLLFFALNNSCVGIARALAALFGLRYLDHTLAAGALPTSWWWMMSALALFAAIGVLFARRRAS